MASVSDRAIHPGIYLGEEIEARGMTQSELARRMERPVQVINEVVRGHKAISNETALGLERVLGTPARVWLSLQSMYEIARARLDEEEELESQAEWLERFPVKAMTKRGWMTGGDSVADQVRGLLEFFGRQSFARWDARQEALALRLSPKARTDEFALHAWVRRGEIEGRAMPTEPYSEARFLDVLAGIRRLTTAAEFWRPMQEFCAAAGVALVAVPEFPKTGAQGAARWLNAEKAMIQVNLRYRWADTFWFTFFHEARHVMNHARKDTFVDVRRGMERDEREHDADRFAADYLIPPDEWVPFASAETYSAQEVRDFASRIGIAPGIVVGRLQYEKIIPRNQLNGLRTQLEFAETD